MHPTIYPALACAVTAALAGGAGLLHVGSASRERTHVVLTGILTTITACGIGGAALLLSL